MCFSSGAGATGSGCFREGAGAWARASGSVCAVRSAKSCRKLKVGPVKLWKEVKAKNHRSGRNMSDAIFVAKKISGSLKIGGKKEIDKAAWRKPRGLRLTPTSRYIRDRLFPN